MWNVVSCVTIVAERNDVFVWAIFLDVDFVEQKLDVCPVLNDADGSENESDDRSVVVVVELHLMGEDGLEWVERLELGVILELEDGSCCALGSYPRRPACWIRPCSSSAVSSLLR
jgi:hypothetical protein